MRANPSLKADDWLNTVYEAGVHGDVLLRTMYTQFLSSNDLFECNFPLSRFDSDIQAWMTQQNLHNSNCKQPGMLVRKIKVLRGDLKGQTVIQNICPVST
eukprot:702019-Rhodomonas_salina.1